MNSVTTVYCDFSTPPPTFNTLDNRQKSRLIRTTRKLGAVLGTTPFFAESASPVSLSPSRSSPPPSAGKPRPFSPKHDRKRRQGSIFELAPPSAPFPYDYASSSASSSAASLPLPRSSTDSNASEASVQSLPQTKSFARHVRDKSKSKGKRGPLPTPLVLRLNAVALPPFDPRLATPDTAATLKSANSRLGASTGAGTGTRSAMPVTPTTPGTPSTPTVSEARRKRLAKLKRTLGENVPVELIMPFGSARTNQQPSPVQVSSALQTPTKPLPRPSANSDSNSTQTKTKGGARKRSASVDLQPAAAPQPPPKPYHRSRAPSLAAHLVSPPPSSHPPMPYPIAKAPREPAHRADSAHVWVTGAASWTGEWNRKDIREVQQQLRTLKLR